MATVLVLEKTSNRLNNDLWDLTLTRYTENGKKIDSLIVNSGAGYNQVFLKAGQGTPANYAPVEEGEYDLGPLEWAGGEDNYGALFPAGEGIGPVWVSVDPSVSNPTRRSAIGIHLDGNRSFAPGTAGCIGIKDGTDLKKLASWFKDSVYGSPKKLLVNWGLGSIKVTFGADENQKMKIFYHSNKLSSFRNDQPVQWTLVKLMQNNNKLGGVINYDEVEILSAEVKLVYKKK